MQKLVIHLTPRRASVTVESNVERETAAATMAQVIDNMPEDDLEILLKFCDGVTSFARRSQRQQIEGLVRVAKW